MLRLGLLVAWVWGRRDVLRHRDVAGSSVMNVCAGGGEAHLPTRSSEQRTARPLHQRRCLAQGGAAAVRARQASHGVLLPRAGAAGGRGRDAGRDPPLHEVG